jgi:[protein-PII] uridylyltransferase
MITTSITSLKKEYKEETDRIFRFHRCGAAGFDTASEIAELTDRTLTALWNDITLAGKEPGAVIALGGYGRYEMCPHSDIDLMIIFPDEKAKLAGAESAQQFLHALWNIGFDIGHSVRTIQDCIRLYQTDVDVWASVLESRYVCGNVHVLKEYTEAMLRAVAKGRDLKFVTSVMEGIAERHAKYGNAVRLLEPNIKNSAGGLRDLHSILWIYRATDTDYFGLSPFTSNRSACAEMFETFEEHGIITHEEMQDAIEALGALLRIRHEMHYGSTSIRDNLAFATQREIARGLRYTGEDELRSVERFMRDYFLHARVIFKMNQRLTQLFRKGAPTSRWLRPKEQILDDVYLLRDGTILLRNASIEFTTPAQLISAFYWSAVHGAEIDPPLLTRLEKSSRMPKLFTPELLGLPSTTAALRAVLSLQKNVAGSLRSMNDCDVLGALIPKWASLVAYVQHSVYHYYTVDAHTLLTIERAELLSTEPGLLGTLFRGLKRRDLLYYALLLHDIEKPSGVAGHDRRGAETAFGILNWLQVDDPFNDVSFLILNHLVMEQTAFRRNFHSPETIAEFASLFGRSEQLDLLFVMTYCDLSAVNTNVWSSWKEAVLEDLYFRAKSHLDRAGSVETTHTEEIRTALVGALAQEYTRDEIMAHCDSFDNDTYVHVFTMEEINGHLAAIRSLEGARISIEAGPSFSTMTVIMRDRPFLLATLCGVLTANDANIIDAQIFTRSDGIVIDRFRIVDVVSTQSIAPSNVQKILSDTHLVLDGGETLEKLFEKHHRRWKRRPKPLMHPNILIDVRFHDAEKFTIIDVYGPDMTGFLYKVAQVVAKLGLIIHNAKIGTRGDGIVDSFYVADAEGRPVRDPEQRRRIREKIVHTIHQLITVQLAQ